jgi:hypothetical protein
MEKAKHYTIILNATITNAYIESISPTGQLFRKHTIIQVLEI